MAAAFLALKRVSENLSVLMVRLQFPKISKIPGAVVARILSCARQANQIPAEPASGGTILQPLHAKIFRLAQDFYLASSAGDNASAKIIIIPNPITEIASHFLFCAPTFTIQVLLEKRCKTTAANISNPTYRCRKLGLMLFLIKFYLRIENSKKRIL